MQHYFQLLLICFSCLTSCTINATNKQEKINLTTASESTFKIDTTFKTIHVFVALCDNKYQGIVPVPSKIGNGQDVKNNLYWSTAYGIKTYFKQSKEWQLIRSQNIDSLILERVIFKHKTKNIYLIADAYNGKNIKECTIDFFKSCAYQYFDTLHLQNKIIGINGYSILSVYIGHDGLMDFSLENTFTNTTNKQKDAIILACVSKKYYAPYLKSTKAQPIMWSTGLMSPEAYTLHDALSSYINKEPNSKIIEKAAMAYTKYQKCSLNASKKLLVTGW